MAGAASSSAAAAEPTRPAGSTLYASFSTTVNANWADGSIQGVAYGGASIASGKLDLKGGTNKYVEFAGILNAEAPNAGAFRITYTPNYSGSPGTDRPLVTICKSTTATESSTRIYHTAAGNLAMSITSDAGVGTVSVANVAAWAPVAGTPYVFELDYDITTGATRLFLNGVQQGATAASTGAGAAINSAGFNLGAWTDGGFPFSGDVAFDAAWRGVNLTAGQVTTLHTYLNTRFGLTLP